MRITAKQAMQLALKADEPDGGGQLGHLCRDIERAALSGRRSIKLHGWVLTTVNIEWLRINGYDVFTNDDCISGLITWEYASL